MTLQMSIRRRLQLQALLAIIAVAVVCGLFLSSNRVNQQALERVFEQDSQTLVRMQRIENLLWELRFRAAAVLLDQLPIPGTMNHLIGARKEIAQIYAEFQPVAREVFADGEAAGQFNRLTEAWNVVDATLGKLDAAYGRRDPKAVAVVLEDDWPALTTGVLKPLQSLIPSAQQRSRETYDDAFSAGNTRLYIGLAGGGACLIVLVVAMLLTTRAILAPLADVKDALQAIASGNLSSRLPPARSDELGAMVQALHAMQTALSTLVQQVRESASSVEVASGEVASGNEDLSSRTERAASNLESTASSTQQLASAVAHSADAAVQASRLASSAAAVAERGGAAVAEVMQTMRSISDSSHRIADIIGIIDGIAFQTNILALNAAVEASRAGEQGRGFGVVAAEVRTLASRSADAAKEIRALIDASVQSVDVGSAEVRKAASTMSEIVNAVRQVTTTIDEVSAASSEQSKGLGQINTAVSTLEDVTQQNAALVEQISAASHSLRDQAMRLTGLVGAFHLQPA